MARAPAATNSLDNGADIARVLERLGVLGPVALAGVPADRPMYDRLKKPTRGLADVQKSTIDSRLRSKSTARARPGSPPAADGSCTPLGVCHGPCSKDLRGKPDRALIAALMIVEGSDERPPTPPPPSAGDVCPGPGMENCSAVFDRSSVSGESLEAAPPSLLNRSLAAT